MMAAATLYKGYLIVSHPTQDSFSKRWSVTVDISSRVPNRHSETISASDRFQTREEAEEWGLKEARSWVDRRP